MRVFGDRYKVLKKKNPDSMWYKTEKQTVRCGFDDWREMYIKDFKVNTAEVVFNGVLDSRTSCWIWALSILISESRSAQ